MPVNHSTKNKHDLWVDRFHLMSRDSYSLILDLYRVYEENPRMPYRGLADSAKQIIEFVEDKPIKEIIKTS